MTLAMNQERTDILNKMCEALRKEDQDTYLEAMDELSRDIEKSVLKQYKEFGNISDAQILNQRGIRQLTSKENKYYEKLIEAFRSNDPKQALTNPELIMPETVIDDVMEELQSEHPLLDVINFENTSFSIKWLTNTNGYQKAEWGNITAEIVKEVVSGFKDINMTQMKLSAFIPVPKSILDLGPAYLDRYVRTILIEALANGLEFGIINNLDTSSGPVGMIADLTKGNASSDGTSITYTAKEAVSIIDLSPETVGSLLSTLAKDEKGNARVIKSVVFIVNPVDYFAKVFPATTVMGGDGTYRKDVLPYPMTVIQSPAVEEGKAIIGLGYRYFVGAGLPKNGKMEFSDEYQFLEDNRVYLLKLYANGKPLDNNSFVVLDITGLKPAIIKVETVTSA